MVVAAAGQRVLAPNEMDHGVTFLVPLHWQGLAAIVTPMLQPLGVERLSIVDDLLHPLTHAVGRIYIGRREESDPQNRLGSVACLLTAE